MKMLESTQHILKDLMAGLSAREVAGRNNCDISKVWQVKKNHYKKLQKEQEKLIFPLTEKKVVSSEKYIKSGLVHVSEMDLPFDEFVKIMEVVRHYGHFSYQVL